MWTCGRLLAVQFTGNCVQASWGIAVISTAFFRHRYVPSGFLSLFAAAGLVYCVYRILFAPPDAYSGFDFHQIWIAGKVWASGQDPYGPAFAAEYGRAFGRVPEIHFLLYPPYWAPIAAPLSLLPFGAALIAWRLVNLALLLLATVLAAKAIAGRDASRFWSVVLAGAGYATLMHATAMTLWIGQTSVLLYAGFAAIMYGAAMQSGWAVAAGLVAVALKPNAGAIVFVAVFAAMPEWRRTVIVAALVLVALAAPAMIHAPVDTVSEFLGNLGRYYGWPANTPYEAVATEWVRPRGDLVQLIANAPENMVGLFHFTEGMPSRLAANVLMAGGVIASLVLFRQKLSADLKFVGLVLIVLLFVPLHGYDIVVVTIPAMFVWSRGLTDPYMLAAWMGLPICMRAKNIGDALHFQNFLPDSGPATVGLLLIAVSVTVLIVSSIASPLRGFPSTKRDILKP